MRKLLQTEWAVSAIVAAILFALAVTYSLLVSFDHPTSDAIYHVAHYVKPFDEGTLEFSQLFDKRSRLDHSHSAAKAFALLNYSLFDLNYRVELITGLLGLGAVTALLLLTFHRQARGLGPIATLGGVCIVAKTVSLNSTHVLGWPLATFEYCMMFLAIVALVMASRILDGTKVGIGKAAAATSVILILGSSMGQLGTALATFVVLGRGVLVDRGHTLKVGLAMLAAFVATTAAMSWLGETMHPGAGPAAKHSLFSFDAVRYVLHAFGQSIIDSSHLRRHFDDWQTVSLLIGGVWLAAQLAIVATFVWRGHWRRTCLPLLLLALGYAFILGTLTSRFPSGGPEYSLSPRYVRLFELNPVAVAWLAVLSYGWQTSHPRAWQRIAIWLLLGTLIGVNVTRIPNAFRNAGAIAKYAENEARDLRAIAAGELDEPRSMRINLADTKVAVRFLQQRKLALFRED